MMRVTLRKGLVVPVFLAVATFLVTLTATVTGKIPRFGPVSDLLRAKDGDSYEVGYPTPEGEQLVMVYFGMSSCSWSNAKGLPEAIEEVRRALREKARKKGWSFVAVGVALDWSVEEGLGHLRKLGHFDEVSVGSNWTNSMAIRYLWEDFPGPAATPQVVVLKRTVGMREGGTGGVAYFVDKERVLTRKLGTVEIEQWVKDRVNLPQVPGT